jgi:CheY-like chemotaxis protein
MDTLAIVDDNETWCFVLALHLRQQGYTVSTFTDVWAFLQQADQFDLALIDFSMPAPRYQTGMDGPELICKVKQQCHKPPLLVLISNFFETDNAETLASLCPEADQILSKQVEMPTLMTQIQQVLANRKQPTQPVKPNSAERPQPNPQFPMSSAKRKDPANGSDHDLI